MEKKQKKKHRKSKVDRSLRIGPSSGVTTLDLGIELFLTKMSKNLLASAVQCTGLNN